VCRGDNLTTFTCRLEPSRPVQACNIEPILFAADTSVIIYNENVIDFTKLANQILACMIEWFSANKF